MCVNAPRTFEAPGVAEVFSVSLIVHEGGSTVDAQDGEVRR